MPDLGTKHTCEECGTKFYDFGNSEAHCPKCGWRPDGTATEPDFEPLATADLDEDDEEEETDEVETDEIDVDVIEIEDDDEDEDLDDDLDDDD